MEIRRLGFGRYALGISLGVAMLAGCGGAQTTLNGAVPQGVMAPQSHARQASGASGDLLYVSDIVTNDVYAYRYPNARGNSIFTLRHLNEPWGLCSDANGNVFVTSYGNSSVVEFAHGAHHLTQTLSLSGGAVSCSVDSATGNLAVVFDSYSEGTGVAIFPNEQGPPTIYYPDTDSVIWNVAYDDAGNLFMDGQTTEERVAFFVLPKAGGGIHPVSVSGGEFYDVDQIQWDGQYIVAQDASFDTESRIQFTGTGYFWSGTVIGVTDIYRCGYNEPRNSTIFDGVIIVPCYDVNSNRGVVKSWAYPGGGMPRGKIAGYSGPYPQAVTISVPPPGSRIRK